MGIRNTIQSAWDGFWGAPAEVRARETQPPPIGEPVALNEFFGMGLTAGASVTPASAITNTAVLGCVMVLSQSVASLPLITYRRTADGKDRATGHALYSILHDLPNPEMTSFDLRETLMMHLTLWGNAYCEIEMNRRGDVLALWPLRPDRTRPVRHDDDQIWYHTRLANNQEIALPKYRVWHIRNLSIGGIMGMSPIALAREAIGLSKAGEELGSRFFSNGAKPGGVLQHPGKLSDEAYERLKGSWEARHQGLDNVNRVAILEEGMQWKDVGMPLDDAQFLETRKFQIGEIARIFRVPPHMIQDLERATFSNIEHQGIDFVTYSLTPWLVRIEQSITRDLVGPIERNMIFAQFMIDGFLRGDIASRYAAYAVGRNWGWLSVNDIRKLENLNPIESGDIYLQPLNMQEAGAPPPPAPTPAPTPAPELPPADQPSPDPAPEATPANASAQRALRTLILDACRRIETRAADRDHKHASWIGDVVRPLVQATCPEFTERDLEDSVKFFVSAWYNRTDYDAFALAENILAWQRKPVVVN
jgi:HK97 family phage portal protein